MDWNGKIIELRDKINQTNEIIAKKFESGINTEDKIPSSYIPLDKLKEYVKANVVYINLVGSTYTDSEVQELEKYIVTLKKDIDFSPLINEMKRMVERKNNSW